MLTPDYLGSPIFTIAYSCMFTYVYPVLLVFTYA